ncbi:hypothetical protein [Micromonospora sp. NPDC005172]|uniref:hypothetical protein n=1 Tax=Micromonospora sp. NPDC005172 TaxID=3156867 RepID=UPI0033B86136
MDVTPEVSALAVQVGGALVTAMFASGWGKAKAMFARATGVENVNDQNRISDRLDQDRQRLASAEAVNLPSLKTFVADKWSEFVVESVIRNPERADEIRDLLSEMLQEFQTESSSEPVVQVARADGFGNSINQVGKNQYNFGSGRG